MTHKQAFLNHLSAFEQTLNKFGYFKLAVDDTQLATYKENLSATFTHQGVSQEIRVRYILWNDGDVFLSMSMYKIPSDKTFFELTDFLKNHGLQDRISWRLKAGGDFDSFAKKYFGDLAALFENELNDQITGKNFENHWEDLMKNRDDY